MEILSLLGVTSQMLIPSELKELWVALTASIALGALLAGVRLLHLRRAPALPGVPPVSAVYPLLSPAITSLFWLIRINPALALGLFGALSFVRFRVPLKRTEDVAYILLLVAVALACSLHNYYVAISVLVLSLGFALVGPVVSRYLVLRSESASTWKIKIDSPAKFELTKVLVLLESFGLSPELSSVDSHANGRYAITLEAKRLGVDQLKALSEFAEQELPGVTLSASLEKI